MTLTIDPKVALIVVDLQKGVVGIPAAHPVDEVIHRAADLTKTFRSHNLPVVLVNVDGGAPGRTTQQRSMSANPSADWTEIVEELDAQPSDYRVTKQTWGAFHNTPLDAYLKERGVTQVVICGISTSAGAETTAREAYSHSYNVVTVADAMTDRNLDVHNNSVANIFPRLSEVATTAEILESLV